LKPDSVGIATEFGAIWFGDTASKPEALNSAELKTPNGCGKESGRD